MWIVGFSLCALCGNPAGAPADGDPERRPRALPGSGSRGPGSFTQAPG